MSRGLSNERLSVPVVHARVPLALPVLPQCRVRVQAKGWLDTGQASGTRASDPSSFARRLRHSPRRPELRYFFPPGAKRGQTVTVLPTGKAGNIPLRVWVTGQGIEFEPAKGSRSYSMKVAADAVPGVRLVRLIDDEGSALATRL